MTEREQLEILITEAIDGTLSGEDLRMLEQKLTKYPGLQEEYRQIRRLPDLAAVYGELRLFHDSDNIQHLLGEFDLIDKGKDKAETGSEWIRLSRYAVAASLAIFAILSLFYVTGGSYTDSYLTAEEMFYPMEESTGENYVLYLNDLFEPN